MCVKAERVKVVVRENGCRLECDDMIYRGRKIETFVRGERKERGKGG